MKEKYVSIATIYNKWFGLGTSKITLPSRIYSLETVYTERRSNKNSEFKNKLSHHRFIATTVATSASSIGNTDSIVLNSLEQITPKTKGTLLEANNYSNSSQKEVN